MPKVFEWKGHRFHFFSYDGDAREPIHIQVAKPGAEAKFWLYPAVRLATSRNVSRLEIRRLEKVNRGASPADQRTHGMTISPDSVPEPTKVTFDEATMWVELSDGRTLGMPLAWYPRLNHASEKDLADHFLSSSGVHWETLYEDLSVRGMLLGLKDQTFQPARAA